MTLVAEESHPIHGPSIRVATLAVGTEITDGQILDRNSQWLSERMLEFSCEIVEHRAVPDDREKILRGLNDLSAQSDVLFVTGGLGPTSDDFTRECVADFLRQPLVWNEEAWAWAEERLKSRGSPITDNQKAVFFSDGNCAFEKQSRNGLRLFHSDSEGSCGLLARPTTRN